MNNYKKFRKTVLFILTFLLSIFLAFTGGEILTRCFWKPLFTIDERNLLFRYDSEFGWFPIENISKQFMGSRLIEVSNNEDGFRDGSHGFKQKKRIVFMGDSFVWGYDVEQRERFTDKLQAMLPEWEIFNMGVSGYGTDQEYILLQKWFDRYQPDIVFLVYCNETDPSDNSTNVAYHGYFKPYFDIVDGKLVKRGVPVPKSINYYPSEVRPIAKSKLIQLVYTRYVNWKTTHLARQDPSLNLIAAIRNYTESKGAIFKIAFTSDKNRDRNISFCESSGIDYLFLTNSYRYWHNQGHWTPEGHDFVCSKIYQFLALR